MKIKIAKMQPEHIPALAVIEQQCFHTPWSENALAAELEEDGSLFLVAEGPEPLGYVGCKTVLDEGYITNVAAWHCPPSIAGTAKSSGEAGAVVYYPGSTGIQCSSHCFI